jgi:hypothetical protein
MTVLIVFSQHRSPKHLAPGAPPLSSHRLHTPAAHHAPALNRPFEHASSGQSAIITGFQPSAILKQTNAAAEPNPHSRLTAHGFPRVPSSEAFGRPPPPGRPLTPGRHPKPFTIPAVRGTEIERQGSSSRPEDSHLRALPEPDVNLSIHTAPDVRPFP